ncbi:hypothetical protein GOBAR_DD04811 [Gossypium barbadense]|nr:hypothetical protein GOBAR_DD04811 [Gossypium barbadense]
MRKGSTAVNVPLGVCKEHTRKFPLSWFAAVPFIVMGRLLGLELKEVAAQIAIAAAVAGYNDLRQVDCVAVSQCGREGTLYGTSSSSNNVVSPCADTLKVNVDAAYKETSNRSGIGSVI